MNDKRKFWYSQQHADWYRHCNEFGLKCYHNTVEIDGKVQDYTCISDENSREPYEGALELFPDYRVIGIATYNEIETKGMWR